MPKFDHHLHTTRYSPDSIIEPEQLIAEALRIGLDGVVITEHDHQWKSDELAELQSQANGLVVLSGVEISAREGHFLVYGLPDLDDVPPGIGLAELLEVVQGHGAAIVGAHPFRWDQDFRSLVKTHGPVFDALELVSNNVTPHTRGLTEALLQDFPMGRTGSSDGHDPEIIGCYCTEFPNPIASMSDFVAAVKSRSGIPRHTSGKRSTSGPVAL